MDRLYMGNILLKERFFENQDKIPHHSRAYIL
jgi:hypothetical protein